MWSCNSVNIRLVPIKFKFFFFEGYLILNIFFHSKYHIIIILSLNFVFPKAIHNYFYMIGTKNLGKISFLANIFLIMIYLFFNKKLTSNSATYAMSINRELIHVCGQIFAP